MNDGPSVGAPAVAEPSAPHDDRHVDLHAHSTASDGSASPTEGVEAAHAAGLTAYALTDHDTLAGIAEAQIAADACGLRLVPGVELSVHQGADEVHLLGLHIRDIAALQDALEVYREHRSSRAEAIVAKLNTAGLALTFDQVLAVSDGAAIGRPHVARALVAAGMARDVREAFDKWLGAGRAAYVDKERLEIAEGIALIHDAGGIAVLAHPGPEGRRELIEPLAHVGLDGLEVRHPSHSREDELRLAALAAHFKLLPSGGSDWHGAKHGGRVLGAMKVPLAWLDAQDARVASIRGANA